MYKEFGGTPLANFPVREVPPAGDEYFNEVKINAQGSTFTEVAVWPNNRSAWPAKMTDQVSYRYFIDITEGIAAGYRVSDYALTLRGSGAVASALQAWDAARNIYYVEVSFPGVKIYPGGQEHTRKEAQLRIALPGNAPASAWNPANDWSYQGLTSSELKKTENVPIYNAGVLLYGKLPDGGGTNNPPVARASGTPTSGAAPLAVSFSASASTDADGDALTYQWSFGDNTTGTGVTTNHTYTAAGTYIATVTVSDGRGGSSQASITITVSGSANHNPVASATATPSNGTAPLAVAFNASASTDPDGDPLTFNWSFGDNTSGTGVTTNHTYTVAGTYIATVTVTDGRGGSAQASLTINVTTSTNHNPVAAISATPTSGSAPLTVSFSASGSTDSDGDPLSYAWAFGDNTTGSGLTVSHVYAAAGTYTAKVTVTDGRGGSGSATVVITATGGNNCKFGTPRATPLPTTGYKQYNYVHVLGTGGPNLSRVTNFTINWDYENNGLWQFSMNTNNGVPNWYVDLRTSMTHSFRSANPALTLTGSGFAGLDGTYYVNYVNGSFVMVSATANFTIYYSNSSVPPACTSTARQLTAEQPMDVAFGVYPNPFRSVIHVYLAEPEVADMITLRDNLGRLIKCVEKESIQHTNEINVPESLDVGMYLLTVHGKKGMMFRKIVKE
jgi:PKD repeat protein